MTFELSPALVELVRACEYGNIFQMADGYDIAADHEVSYALFARDGLFQLGRYERRGPIALLAASTDILDLERMLVIDIGNSYRHYNGLPAIELPYAPEDVRTGYQVVHLGGDIFSLRGPDGEQLGIQIDDYQPTVPVTCRFSHVADLPVDDLVASYLDPHAAPLLTQYLAR